MSDIQLIDEGDILNSITIKDNSIRSKNLLLILKIYLTFSCIYIAFNFYAYDIYYRIINGYRYDYDEYNNLIYLNAFFILIALIFLILIIILFLNWYRRAYGNLIRLKINQTSYSEKMALWFWFIPIINIFKPYEIMKDIAFSTQNKILEINSELDVKSHHLILRIWWVLFIITNSILILLRFLAYGSKDRDEILSYANLELYISCIDVVKIYFFILVVKIISKNEETLKQLLDEKNLYN